MRTSKNTSAIRIRSGLYLALILIITGSSEGKWQGNFVEIVYCSDGNYMEGVGASISSIVTSTASPHRLSFKILTTQEEEPFVKEWLSIHINSNSKSAQRKDDYQKLFPADEAGWDGAVPIDVKVFDASRVEGRYAVWNYRGGHSSRYEAPLNFARYYIADYWPSLALSLPHQQEHQKVIYIDPDTIVQKDLVNLYDKALAPGSPYYFGAFKDCAASWELYFNTDHPLIQEKFRPDACGFEAGFYITRLDEWVANNVTQKLEEWLSLNQKERLFNGGSQAPLMAVFYENYEALAPVTGFQHRTGLGHKYDPTERPKSHDEERFKNELDGIIEWNGDHKPWYLTGTWKSLWKPHKLRISYEKFKKNKALKRRS